MEDLKGLYLELPACGHTYGVSAINDVTTYACLDRWFRENKGNYKIFRQSDSQRNGNKDFSYLFIEFLGEKFDDDSALSFVEHVADYYGLKLSGIL